MKTLYVYCSNHMDPTWLRRWRGDFVFRGRQVRSYSDLEEMQVKTWMDMVERGAGKYSIEQTLTARSYLERNPERLERFRELAQQDRIEIMGGGETVIDTNMVGGESLVRNHFHSIRWCRETLGVRPRVAVAPDTFGLSAQLPQVLRAFGYDALAMHDRVFESGEAFWRGLDGSTLCIARPADLDAGQSRVGGGDGGLNFPPDCCQGEGCAACGFTGIDYSQLVPSATQYDAIFADLAAQEGDVRILHHMGEEFLPRRDFFDELTKRADGAGVEVRFVTLAELMEGLAAPLLDQLRSGGAPEDRFVPAVEGNPICTGCYASRIELKKLNRELEGLLQAAETFAALAAERGATYPRRKIERLWRQMALFQFHDSITSSHVDAVYGELRDLARQIRLGAGAIYRDAALAIEADATVPDREGWRAFLLFNPLNWTVRGRLVEAWLPLEGGANLPGIEIEDTEGKPVEIVEKEDRERIADRMLRVRFIAPELPPFGYATFHYRLTPKAAPAPGIGLVARRAVLENDRYRIELDPSGVVNARDKRLDEEILTRGAGGLILEEDYGSPWETLARPYNRVDLREHSETRVSVLRGAGRQCAVIEGAYRPAFIERGKLRVKRLEWRQEIAIYDGADGIHVRTEIDWDSENCRVMLQFPLPFRTPNDEAFYEVPFGVLKRAAYDGRYGEHTLPNGDWPALNYVSCYSAERNFSVDLLNKGIPCHQVRDGIIYATPLRSPQLPVYAFDFEGARDTGRHVFEHVVAAHRGSVADGAVARSGAELNATFLSLPASAKEAALPPQHAFLFPLSDSLIYSALKRAEDDAGLVARAYEPYGKATDESFAGLDSRSIEESDPLEERSHPVESLEFRPFEIKTFRIPRSATP